MYKLKTGASSLWTKFLGGGFSPPGSVLLIVWNVDKHYLYVDKGEIIKEEMYN